MRSHNYYLVRTYVRFVFWTSVAFGLIWLLATSFSRLGDYKCYEADVVVLPYETLWAIAEEYCEGDIRSAVQDLITENGSASLQIGQVVKVRNND